MPAAAEPRRGVAHGVAGWEDMGGDGEAPWIPTNPTLRLFATLAFGLDRRQTVSSDSATLLVSPASFDSFSQIGPPPVTDLENSFPNANDLKDLWKRMSERVFSQENISKEKGRKDSASIQRASD